MEELADQDIEVTLFYYNPNIHPSVEWERRLEGAVSVAKHFGVPLVVEHGIAPEAWRSRSGLDDERCHYCYTTRLGHTADAAADQGFDAVSTTLLVSPYQKRDMIIASGTEAAEARGIEFIPYDWRPLFRHGQHVAKELGIYRQKYCGCIISLEASKFYDRIALEHDELAVRHCAEAFASLPPETI